MNINKILTTDGKAELIETGSNEVSFNLQFYNDKDVVVEHIETTPQKINGLDLQNREKSEADQLCDQIKTLVAGYYYLDASKAQGIANIFSEMIVRKKEGNWADNLGFRFLKWFVKNEVGKTVKDYLKILDASINNYKTAKGILDSLKKQLDNLENESSKKENKNNLEQNELKNTLKQTVEALDLKVNQLKELEETTKKNEGSFKKMVDKNDLFETSFLYTAKRNLFTPKNYLQNFNMKFETVEENRKTIQESISIPFAIAPAGWAMSLFSILGGVLFLMASLVINPDYFVDKPDVKTDNVFQNHEERTIFSNGLKNEINNNSKFLSIAEERDLKNIIDKINKNTEFPQDNEESEQPFAKKKTFWYELHQTIRNNPIIRSLFLVIVIPPVFFSLFIRFGKRRFSNLRNNVIYPFAIGSVIGLGHKNIPIILESVRNGSVNQFNRILRSISNTNVSLEEILNSSSEKFSLLQQFIDLV